MITITKKQNTFTRQEFSSDSEELVEVQVTVDVPERNLTEEEKLNIIYTHSDSTNYYYYEIGEEDLVKTIV
jgi:hypothetical protein